MRTDCRAGVLRKASFLGSEALDKHGLRSKSGDHLSPRLLVILDLGAYSRRDGGGFRV